MGFSFEYILVLIIALVLIFDFVSKKTNDKLINSEDRIGKKVKENKPSLKYFTKRPRIIILFIAAISLSILSINLINSKSSVKGILSKKIIAKLPVSCIELSPNKNLIAVADDTNDPLSFNKLDEVFNITIFNSSNYRKIYELSGHNESIESINFSLDSKKLISTDKSGEIKVWDLTNGTEIISVKTNEWVHDAKFSSSGKEFIAIQGFEKIALIYDLEANLISKLNVNKQINDFEYDPRTDRVYFGCHKEIQIWSLSTKKLIFKKPFDVLMCMSFDHEFSNIAIGTNSGEIIVLSSELEEIIRLKGHFKPVLSVSFSFDNAILASSSSDQTSRVWDLRKGSEILQLTNEHKGNVSSVEFVSKNNEFITGGKNTELKLWK